MDVPVWCLPIPDAKIFIFLSSADNSNARTRLLAKGRLFKERELAFLFATHSLDKWYTLTWYVKLMNMSHKVQYLWRVHTIQSRADKNTHKKEQKGRVVILVNSTSSWNVIPTCEVSWMYPTRFRSYAPETNFSQGHFTQKRRKREFVFCYIVSIWYTREIIWIYPIRCSSYGAYTHFS